MSLQSQHYRAIHKAITAVWGKPSKCELCGGKNKSKRFEWSCKEHNYTLDKKDWWQLCSACHRKYDREKFGWKGAWNKGRKGRQENHDTSGLKPGWNKGMRGKQEVVCICGKKFYPPKKSSRFCSKHCAMLKNKRASTLKENGLI